MTAFFVLFFAAQDPIRWVDSFPKGAVLARHSGKPMLLYFWANWCGGCRALEQGALRDPKLAAAIHKVVPVRVDMELEPDIATRYGIRFFPSFAMIEAGRGRFLSVFQGRRTADAISDWIRREAPRGTAWFDSVEEAEATGRAVASVAVESGEPGARFLESLRSDAVLATWEWVAYVRIPGEQSRNELVLREAGSGREILRTSGDGEGLASAILRALGKDPER